MDNATVLENNGAMNGSGFNLEDQQECIYENDNLGEPVFHAFVYVIYFIVFLVSLVGNGLVIFVVLLSPPMKTATNFFIMNLAMSDILMSLFCIPFSFVPMLILRYWPFGEFMCKLVNYSQAVSVLVSAYTLLTISFDKYFVITRPLKPRMTKKLAKQVICIVWFGASVIAAPRFVQSTLQKSSSWDQTCDMYNCSEKWTYLGQYTNALLILQFALPLIALIYSYGRIAYIVWRKRPPGEPESVRDMRIRHCKKKMIKMMITVVVVFTVCWLPLNVFTLLHTAHEDDDDWNKWPGMPYTWFLSHCLAMSHSCFNPIIYGYMNANYRNGFVQAFRKLLCLKTTSADNCSHRTNVNERIPLSDLMNINKLSSQRSLSRCKCKITRSDLNSLELNRKCTSSTSLRRTSATPSAPARAVSFRSYFV